MQMTVLKTREVNKYFIPKTAVNELTVVARIATPIKPADVPKYTQSEGLKLI